MQGLRLAMVFSGVLLTSSALGQQAPHPSLVEGDVSLEYRRAPEAASCPDEAAFRERAADAFRFHDPFVRAGAGASAHLRIEITRTDSGFLGTMFAVDARGTALATSAERHADCDALVWILGHRMALAILPEPSAPAPCAERPPAPPPRAPRCDERCVDEIATRVAERLDPPRALTTQILLGSLAVTGLSVEPGLGAWIGVAARRPWISLALEARALLVQPVGDGADARGTASAFSALAVPCVHLRSLALCGAVELGELILREANDSAAAARFYYAVGPRASFNLRLTKDLDLFTFAELSVHPDAQPIVRPEHKDQSWTLPTVSGAFGIGVALTR